MGPKGRSSSFASRRQLTTLQNTYITSGAASDLHLRGDLHRDPTTVPYRRPPRLTPKPIMHGTQTAIVTGPQGEEIYVDKYGRVKVAVPLGPRGHIRRLEFVLWIRVSRPHGPESAWGMVHIPRIGQEVVVSFLEGDPDRPGSSPGCLVYNAEQMPPYALPDNKTQSGIKSRSSLGGTSDNFNELRFEDKKGSAS